MPAITQPAAREIVDDFAREIREKRTQTSRPTKHVINFRTDIRDNYERDVWLVPIGILRFRKDNGRIASDVLDYETNIGPLDEKDAEAQATIAQ